MNAVIGYGIYLGGAFALALALVIGFAVSMDIGRRSRQEFVPLAFFAMVLAIMAVPIGADRVLTAGLSSYQGSEEDFGSSFWASRILTLFVLGVCAERVGRHLLQRGEPLRARPLWWAFLAFALAGQVLNSAFGAKPSFDQKALYAFLAFFAFFVSAQSDPDRFFRTARWALLLFLGASAVAIAVRPATVLEFGYAGFLPGVSFRYYGLATHANTMGPLAIATAILLWRFPLPNALFNTLAWLLAGASLLLTQSKTSLAIGIGIAIYLWIHRTHHRLRADNRQAAARFGLLIWATSCIVLAAGTLAVLAAANSVDWALGKFDTVTGSQWATLTGRTRIWALAWHEFLSHPVFGYGPRIWDPEYRHYAQLPFAAHAHNQLLQSLSSAGTLGGVTMLAYALTLLIFAIRANAASGGVSVALVALVLLRSVSEVPLASASIMQAEFIVQMLAVGACVAFAPRTVAAARKAHASAVSTTLAASRPAIARQPAALAGEGLPSGQAGS